MHVYPYPLFEGGTKTGFQTIIVTTYCIVHSYVE